MLALLCLALVSAQDELASWNSQYVFEILNKTHDWDPVNFLNFTFKPFYAFHQVDLPFTFSFFFAPLRELFIDTVGNLQFDSQPPCCTNNTCAFSLNLSTGLCNLNTTYYNMFALFLGNQTVTAMVRFEYGSFEVRYTGPGIQYGVVLYNDSGIELNIEHLPTSPDRLVGLRRPLQTGPADSIGTWPTVIGGVYPPPELLYNNSQIVFCPINTVFCVTPTNISTAGGDTLSVTTGTTNLDCLRKRVALSCKFINRANTSEFVLTLANAVPALGALSCITPAMSNWTSVDLKLVRRSTGQELFHDSRSLLRLTLGNTTIFQRSICDQCQRYTLAKNCPIDCARVVLGNATLDDCRVCIVNRTANLDKNCRGSCYDPTPIPASECLCNQSGIPAQNQQVVTDQCWDGLAAYQPTLLDVLTTTNIVNVYRLAAAIFCAIGLVLLPCLWVSRQLKACRTRGSRSREREAIPLS